MTPDVINSEVLPPPTPPISDNLVQPSETSASEVVQDLTHFLSMSPTAWNAVDQASRRLVEAGFQEVEEGYAWDLEPGGKYFTTRNGSSLCAFVLSKKPPQEARILGAHTDSPGLKLKPHFEKHTRNYLQFMPEYYGGPILPSFLNRELGLAGRVTVLDGEGKPHPVVIDCPEPIAFIPSLAVHLDRSQVQKVELNAQQHLGAIAGLLQEGKEYPSLKELLCPELQKHLEEGQECRDLLSHELFLVPVDEPKLVGFHQEMLASARLDNLLGTHACLTALIQQSAPSEDRLKMVVAWDNEEVGSKTPQGANSSFLPDVLNRISDFYDFWADDRVSLLQRSLLVSNDVAHALHPNYADKHEPLHEPLMEGGPVIKTNSQQRYATDSVSSGLIKALCRKRDIPFQEFVVRSDCGCGSTIGPIVAGQLGLKTIDVGSPVLSMHNARELCSVKDHLHMLRLMEAVLED